MKKEDFESFMKKVADSCLTKISIEKPDISSGTKFEKFVYNQTLKLAEDEKNIDADKLNHTSNQEFPDITYEKHGVEVKFSKNGWKSTGNSVKEGTRVENIEKILVFFFRSDKNKIKIRPYPEVLSDVVVTHSPRYKIDMSQNPTNSVFYNINTDYEEFRSQDYPMSKIREYMKKKMDDAGEVWYIGENSPEPYIKNYKKISNEEKLELKVESMILFPEIFSNNHFRTAVYLLKEHQLMVYNLRDWFSSGGRKDIEINGEKMNVSHKKYRLYSLAPKIKEKLESMDENLLKSKWNVEKIDNREEKWLKLLAEELDSSNAIYQSGLN